MDTTEPQEHATTRALIAEAEKRYDHYDLPNRLPMSSWSDREVIEALVAALSVYTRPETAENLLDTRAGLALANIAWSEGASAAIRAVNRYEDEGGTYTSPANPYSVAHLVRIKADAAEPVPPTPEAKE